MGSRVLDAAFLTAAVIAFVAFGLLILLPGAPAENAGASPSPSTTPSIPLIRVSPPPSIVITVAPATSAPPSAVPSTPAPTTAAPTAARPPTPTPPPSASR